MALNHVLSQCSDQWRRQGITLAPPIDEAEVRRVWGELGHPLSADVLCVYATIAGFSDYTFEEDFFWSFWPWDWLQQRNAENPGAGVMFCDHSIEVVVWEFRYEDGLHSSVWRSQPAERVADTVEAFFERYLADPWQLL